MFTRDQHTCERKSVEAQVGRGSQFDVIKLQCRAYKALANPVGKYRESIATEGPRVPVSSE